MRPLSIRARLTLWYTGVVAAILILVGVAAYSLLRWHLYNDLDASLFTVADVLREAPPVDPTAPLPPDLEPLVRGFLGSEFSDALMQLLDPEGRLRSRALRPALPLSPEARENALHGAPTLETVALGTGEQARLLTMPVVRGGRIVDLVQVAMPLRRTRQALVRYVETLLVLLPLGAVLSAIGGWFLARRALRPVDRMSHSALEISAQDLSRRLELRGTNDEIDRLADTLNAMLARLEAAFAEMQRFTADAAHELRTPLTALRGGIEVALRAERSREDYRGVLTSSLEEVEQLVRLTEDLLLLSRSTMGLSASRQPVDLEPLCLEALELGVRLAKGKGVSVSMGATVPAVVQGDAGALRRAVLNLVDNAVKYTPAGGSVVVSLERSGERVSIAVEDTGIGIDPADAERVFEPFVRLDAGRSRDTGGTGLGLAIARSIVLAHRGTLEVKTRTGGSRFTIDLPAA
ncbi:MAG TPA: heavy metal sensor histidine kinase [Methylomirabilota bacterium]|nr:heavy metal sensor histidine kinase [Methylomirabilota bacterium]